MSTHKQFDCIACHLPNRNFVESFAYKAKAGLRDVVDEFGRSYESSRRSRRKRMKSCRTTACAAIRRRWPTPAWDSLTSSVRSATGTWCMAGENRRGWANNEQTPAMDHGGSASCRGRVPGSS